MENLDSLDDLVSGKPHQPQPDWAEEDIQFRRQKSFLLDPWEEEDAITADTQEDAGLQSD